MQPFNLAPDLNDATLRWLNDLAAQGILTTDPELRIASWNRWLEQHTGYRADDVVGRHLFAVYPDLQHGGLSRRYEQALAGQIVVLSHRLHRFLLPMPSTIVGSVYSQMQQSVRIAPLTSDTRIVGTITLIEDVTERVVREDELRQQIEELQALQTSLQEAIREREAFVSIASHELKTPLAGLLGHAHMMQRRSERGEPLSERSQHSLRTIIQQADRLNRMINSLLDVSRVQTGQLTVERGALDLGTLVERVVAEQQPALSKHTLTLSEPEHPLIVAGDEVRLTQVFANLLSNAIKYSPAGGPIAVGVTAHSGYAHVSVADQGVGIAPAAQANVFQRFFRVPGEATEQASGLGIGLYVVKEIVAKHGGSITVESAVGQGSTFTVHLPLVENADAL